MTKQLILGISKVFNNPKLSSILIVMICIVGVILGKLVEPYRISNYRWIYQYGKMIGLVMVSGTVFWSFLHPIIVWSEKRKKWKKHLIWILIGMIPIL